MPLGAWKPLAPVTLAWLTLLAVSPTPPRAFGVEPPFFGTAFLGTQIITEADASTFDGLTPLGLGDRWVFGRRVDEFVFRSMHLFRATFEDGLTAEVQVNPTDFASQASALDEALRYALPIGRLPTSLREDVDTVTIHAGAEPFGGGNNNLLIHTGQAVIYDGYLEEILFHEATHTSYDADNAAAAGWLAAQQSDPTFVSTYARDFPARKDVAESLLPWYALRYTDTLSVERVAAIESAIPARLAYFDTLPFALNPAAGVAGDYNGSGAWTWRTTPCGVTRWARRATSAPTATPAAAWTRRTTRCGPGRWRQPA